MQKTMKELVDVLDQLVQYHRDLLEVEQKKLSSIVDQDWEELEILLLKSRKILTNIETAEKRRMSIIQELCGKEDIRLSEVEKEISGDLAPRIRNCGNKLVELIQRQKSMNEKIERLLKSSLEIVNFSLSLFAGSGAQGRTYSGKGEEKGNGEKCSSFVFDIKA